jgi:hypothetical protein
VPEHGALSSCAIVTGRGGICQHTFLTLALFAAATVVAICRRHRSRRTHEAKSQRTPVYWTGANSNRPGRLVTAQVRKGTDMALAQTSVILTHGAWADGSSWVQVIKPLQSNQRAEDAGRTHLSRKSEPSAAISVKIILSS